MIALGGGLGVLAVRLVRRDAPPRTATVVAAAGSFAALSTLLGSPLTGAFLLMEATGLGGPMLGLVLVPGLLAAGVGSLIFIGLDASTGLGTFSLAIPGLPHVGNPTGAGFLWALAIGLITVPLGSAIRRLGLFLRPHVERRLLLATPVVALAIAGLAIAYAAATGKGSSDVLFSGQSDLGPFIAHSASYTVGALLLLLACKGLAYGASLSSFRGGPHSRPCSSARRAASPCRTCRGCRSSTRRHGHRRYDRGDAQAAVDLGVAGHLAAGVGRRGRDAAGDRGGRGGIRGLGQAHANPSPRSPRRKHRLPRREPRSRSASPRAGN